MSKADLSLLAGPVPIDRVARRVTKKSAPENLWQPPVRIMDHNRFSREIIRTGPLPKAAPKELHGLIGKRRGSMVIIGYAEEQPKGRCSRAQWVVRCDCGNYEGRSRILRWLGTVAPDFCLECCRRAYLKSGNGEYSPRAAASRNALKLDEINPVACATERKIV